MDSSGSEYGTQCWPFGFHKRWEILWLADRLIVSQEVLCFMYGWKVDCAGWPRLIWFKIVSTGGLWQ